jgi:Ca2+-binding EF-hand superfamily protein
MAATDARLDFEISFLNAFIASDVNHDGQLSEREFKAVLSRFTLNSIPTKHLFKIVDTDGNGFVSNREFRELALALWDVTRSGDSISFYQMIFRRCDSGQKGYLTPREFSRFMEYSGSPIKLFYRNRVLRAADRDGSGTFDFGEIMNYLNAN